MAIRVKEGKMNVNLQVYTIKKALKRKGIEPDTVDVRGLVDPELHLYENMKLVSEFVHVDLYSGADEKYIERMLAEQDEYDQQWTEQAKERIKNDDNISRDKDIEIERNYMKMKWKKILPLPSVALVTGKRGSGKSACGYWLLCHLSKEYNVPAYAIGLPPEKYNLLPDYIKPLELSDIENLPENAIIFIDEAGMLFYAREWKNDQHALMDKLLSISRQKNQIIILATHTSRKLDVAIVMDCDAVIIKEPSLLHAEFERREIKRITGGALEKFKSIPDDERKSSCYVYAHSIQGEILTNPLPDFWTEDLSKAFAGIGISKPEKKKRSKKGGFSDDNLERQVEESRERTRTLRSIENSNENHQENKKLQISTNLRDDQNERPHGISDVSRKGRVKRTRNSEPPEFDPPEPGIEAFALVFTDFLDMDFGPSLLSPFWIGKWKKIAESQRKD